MVTDSDYDGVPDHLAIQGGETNAFILADIDSLNAFGIHNAYLSHDPGSVGTPLFTTAVLNEACWSNTAGPASVDGKLYDWIEIYNPTFSTQDLADWQLRYTKPSGNVTTSTLPDGTVLPPGAFLIVFCSGLPPASVPTGEAHTSFKLDVDNPGKIELLRPVAQGSAIADGLGATAIVDFRARAGLSFGRWPDPHANGTPVLTTRYFSPPTPAAHNHGASFEGITPEPRILDYTTGQSLDGGIFHQTTLEAKLDCPACPGAVVTYTTNCADPSWRSEIFEPGSLLAISNTAVIRAAAQHPGWLPSRTITRSFLFKESVLGTAPAGTLPTDHQQNPPGYPQWTLAAAPNPAAFPIDYAVNEHAISDHRGSSESDPEGLLNQLTAIPTISIAVPVSEFFDPATGGIYASESFYAPRRAGSFEWIDPPHGIYQSESTEIGLAGGSSRRWDNIAKKSLTIKFRKALSLTSSGRFTFAINPFPALPYDNGAAPNSHDRLRLRNPSQDSWALYGSQFAPVTPERVGYINNACHRKLAASMGMFVPRSRWVHLYLNGLYWGLYELIEPVHDSVLAEHEFVHDGSPPGSEEAYADGNYEIAGDFDNYNDVSWEVLDDITCFQLNELPAVDDRGTPNDPSDDRSAWDFVASTYDLESYVDAYLLAYVLQTYDQTIGNFYWWRRNAPGSDGKFRYLLWDADFAFGDSTPVGSSFLNFAGSVGHFAFEAQNNFMHHRMRGFPPYQRIFAERLQQHLIDSNGTLFGSRPLALFDEAAAEIAPFLDSEAMRWGDANPHPSNPAGFSRSDWLLRTTEMRSIIPLQLASIENQAKDLGLWPGTQGPEIEVYLPGMTVGVDEPVLTPGGYVPFGSTIVLTASGRTIQYFAEPGFPSAVNDPKLTANGRLSAASQASIVLNTYFDFTVKARTFDPSAGGYSGLSEIHVFVE
jgi:hypothetical protein